MKPAPAIKLVHALPGRIRLKSGHFKGNPELLREVVKNLKAVPAVTQVEGNAVTGSVLIFCEPHKVQNRQSLRQISGVLKAVSPELSSAQVAQFFKPGPVAASPPAPLAASIAQFFGALNTTVGNALGGLDLKVLLPATLFFLGIRGMIAEKATPPAWYNLLWFALATFMMFHPAGTPGLAEAEALSATVEGVADLAVGD